MSLISSITSNYFTAANKLAPKGARRRIVAYVESYDDIFFWRTLLSPLEDDKHYYEVLLPTQRGRLGRGKKCVMKMILHNRVGRDMIACVDADYDYLVQGATDHSQKMLTTPFVYHTYAYAIENWQCWAPSLHQVAVMVTLNDRHLFDFQAYLRKYSEIVYPLFLWSVFLYRREEFRTMSLTEMDRTVTPGRFHVDNPDQSLTSMQKKVETKLVELSLKHPEFNEEKQIELGKELLKLGVRPDECYLFVHGHHLLDKVVTPMLTNVCSRLRHIRENDIRNQAVHQTQMNAELAGYTHATEAVSNMLRKNTMWLSAPMIRTITDKIISDKRQ